MNVPSTNHPASTTPSSMRDNASSSTDSPTENCASLVNEFSDCAPSLDALRAVFGSIIQSVCQDLQLPPPTACLACIYFHRVFPKGFTEVELSFYSTYRSRCSTSSKKSISVKSVSGDAAAVSSLPTTITDYNVEDLASPVTNTLVACVFLACKVSESPIKLRDCVNAVDYLKWMLKSKVRGETSSLPESYKFLSIQEYWNRRDECLKEESRILHLLGFSLNPIKVFHLLLEVQYMLQFSHLGSHIAWTVIADAVASPILETTSVETLIVASVIIASRLELLGTITNVGVRQLYLTTKEKKKDLHLHSSLPTNWTHLEDLILELTESRGATKRAQSRNNVENNLSDSQTSSNSLNDKTSNFASSDSFANLISQNEKFCFYMFERLQYILLDADGETISTEKDAELWEDVASACIKILQNYQLLNRKGI